MKEMETSQVQKNEPSNVMQILDVFDYAGIKVVIRKWYNCYEYLLVHHGELFCDYVQYGKIKTESSKEDMKGIVDHLRSAAIDTIEYHNERSKLSNRLKSFIKTIYEKSKTFAFSGNKGT